MTCYEYLRKAKQNSGKEFYRLQNYFQALEENKEKEYHQSRGRK